MWPREPQQHGVSGRLTAAGTPQISSNSLTLIADRLPLAQFGYFLTASESGLVLTPAGSSGNLCLGASIGRFNAPSQVLNTGTSGAASLLIPLQQLPTPSGAVAASVGGTRYFQFWFRDIGGAPTANFTNGLAIRFE